jgi:hypothetical protein
MSVGQIASRMLKLAAPLACLGAMSAVKVSLTVWLVLPYLCPAAGADP